jgi:thiamine biosynthesis protein ThiS
MEIIVNGERKPLEQSVSVEDLLARLEIKTDRVAVELNRQILRRPLWAATQLQDNDRLEIVQFVGGG